MRAIDEGDRHNAKTDLYGCSIQIGDKLTSRSL